MAPTNAHHDDVTTPVGVLQASAKAAGLIVSVSVEGKSFTSPLPSSGSVIVGRARDAGICIDHPSVSRRHALFEIGERISVQDLGSQNGTRVRGAPLVAHVPVDVALGETIEIGLAKLLVRVRGADDPAPEDSALRGELRSFERDRIRSALERCGGNQTKTAQMLGISRRTLVSRLTEYGFPRPKK